MPLDFRSRSPDIEYIVVDEKFLRDRVALAHEEIETYDASYYETQLVRAVESVLSPLGWERTEIQQELVTTLVETVELPSARTRKENESQWHDMQIEFYFRSTAITFHALRSIR